MPERILVVDDEPNMLRLLKTILMDKTGYEVTTTNNPLEVSKMLQEDHYRPGDHRSQNAPGGWHRPHRHRQEISTPPCPSL